MSDCFCSVRHVQHGKIVGVADRSHIGGDGVMRLTHVHTNLPQLAKVHSGS